MSFSSALSPPPALRPSQAGPPSFGRASKNVDERPQASPSPPPASASASLSGGGASAAFASLAHSYSQLLDCMESPHEHNVTPTEMGDLLAFLQPRLLANTTTFRPPSTAATQTMQKGKVKSSFPNEKGVFEEQELHEDWIKIVVEFSQAMVSPFVRPKEALHPSRLRCVHI